MYNLRCLIIYPFPTSHFNSSWWSMKAVPWNTNDLPKKFLACQLLRGKCNGATSSSTQILLFERGTSIILRELLDRNDLEWEIYLYDIYSLVDSLIITLIFHCTLYLIHNEWSRKLEKIRGNIKCFSTLSLPWRNL